MYIALIVLFSLMSCNCSRDTHFQQDNGLKYKYDELSALSGGRHPIPVDDEHIVHVSNWAARKLGGKLRKITHAEEQVVSGLMYYIDMDVSFQQNLDKQCSVKIWTQDWLQRRRLVHSNCKK